MSDTISFTVNGSLVNGSLKILRNPEVSTSLNQWLRRQPGLTGTKVMCNEGGCGCCAVAITRNGKTKAVNSCLLPLCSVDGCDITTIEGIGSLKKGHHPVQKRVAKFNATQCGYCTPGFVVNMYSALEGGNLLTQQQIEDKFDGNLCRCTGYRSIMDAMKSFASDADPKLTAKCCDIEELSACQNRSAECHKTCGKIKTPLKELRIKNDGCKWVRPLSVPELMTVMNKAEEKVKIICGNTGSGVFREEDSASMLYIDIKEISDFGRINLTDDFLEIGAAVTLQDLHDFLIENAEKSVTFLPLAKHIAKVASVPVRNAGSWAGNLMLKHKHRTFQSDIFTIFVGAGAALKLMDVAKREYDCDLCAGKKHFLNEDMGGKIIISASIPVFRSDEGITWHMKSYKVMPRSQNAHAYVNAAFRASVYNEKDCFGDVIIAYGGVSTQFVRAHAAEKYLIGKPIHSDETLKGAINVLLSELKPEKFDAADVSCDYKDDVAVSLFFKFFVSVCDPEKISTAIISAASVCERKVSSGTQSYDVDQRAFPVSQPIPKLSAQPQAAGEAYYSSDRVPTEDELYAQFVPATIANADIDEIDVSEALTMKGCVDIVYRDNFPSDVKNTYFYPSDPTQPIIATDHTEFAGQPVAMVIAESAVQAKRIAKAVKVTYKNCKKPILTFKDAIQQESFFTCPLAPVNIGDATTAIKNAGHKVSGEIVMGSQYHMYMETQFARVAPTEEGGFEIESSTQAQKWVQRMLSYSFDIPCNKIYIHTKRLGGSYGGKSSNSLLPAAAAALAAHVTRRPVRMHPDMQECMETCGMRSRFHIQYTVGVDNDGKLLGMDWHAYEDCGCSDADGEADDESVVLGNMDNAYFCENWKFTPTKCKTNYPSRTWTRAPGVLNMIGMVECIMEHAAFELKMNPIDLKMRNLYRKGQRALFGEPLSYCSIREIYDKLLTSADVRRRQKEILEYNANNKWKKRGIAVTPMKYSIGTDCVKYNVLVAIYAQDGSVAVTHGGIETGQGINVKTVQVAAHVLNIPLDIITVHQTSTLTSPNASPTGGSVASEVNCMAVKKCCEILAARIAPVRSKMGKDATWKEVIKSCDESAIDLCAEAMFKPEYDGTFAYCSYGTTASEVELDVLTGQHQIRRVDLIQDCGVSLNPAIDIGQTEGAFVMGLGYWLSEKLVYDPTTGQLLTNRTWNYKVPSSKDIPEVWNVELLKGAENPSGFMRSKTAGEPPLCMAVGVFHALKHAVEATRAERGLDEHIQMDAPATIEDVKRLIALNPCTDLSLK